MTVLLPPEAADQFEGNGRCGAFLTLAVACNE
jgi:hypothetical protein